MRPLRKNIFQDDFYNEADKQVPELSLAESFNLQLVYDRGEDMLTPVTDHKDQFSFQHISLKILEDNGNSSRFFYVSNGAMKAGCP
jgi:hypothetical protein